MYQAKPARPLNRGAIRTRDTSLDAQPAPTPIAATASPAAPAVKTPGATGPPRYAVTSSEAPDPAAAPVVPGGRVQSTVKQERVRKGDDGDPFADSLEEVGAAQDEERSAAAEPEPAVVEALSSPPSMRAEWTASTQLAADALALPPVPKKQDDTKPAEGTSPEAEARTAAQRGYASLAVDAARAQSDFVLQAQRTAAEMSEVYQDEAQRTLTEHQAKLGEVDHFRDQALSEIDRSAAAADGALEIVYRNTVNAVQRASRSAHGRIAVNYQRADAQINTILSGLVKGHIDEFTSAIEAEEKHAREAATKIDQWADARATHYPTNRGGLASAKNEERQKRAPRMAQDEKKALNDRKTDTVKSWNRSQTQSVSSIQCGYRCQLDQHKRDINTKGHASVARALASALKTLRTQTREGRKAIAATRASGRAQIEALAQATRARLVGETKAALGGARHETAAAQRGVHAATQATAAGFPRLAQRLEETLRQASQRGPQGLVQVARSAPQDLARALVTMRAGNLDRLAVNQVRLTKSLADRRGNAGRAGQAQSSQAQINLSQAVGQSGPALLQAGDNFTEGFAALADEVSRAADAWAAPFEKHFSEMLKRARTDVERQLQSLLTGAAPPAADKGAGTGAQPAPAGGKEAGCGPCDTPAADAESGSAQGSQGQTQGAPGPEAPRGLNGQKAAEKSFFDERGESVKFFEPHLLPIDQGVHDNLLGKATTVGSGLEAGIIDTVDEGKVTGALRGLSRFGGAGVEEEWLTEAGHHTPLRTELRQRMDPLNLGDNDDLNAALAYLNGDTARGAAYELSASLGTFNDDEARIEQTMGALTPAQLQALGRDHAGTLDKVQGALDGTDERVFQALRKGDYATASALRLRDRVDEARRDGDAKATNAALTDYSHGPMYSGWQRDMEERGLDSKQQTLQARQAVMGKLGELVADADVAHAAGAGGVAAMSAEDRAVAYVTRPVEVEVGGGDMPPQTITLRIEGANRDLAEALIRNGDGSIEARAARLGVEMQRTGDTPQPLEVDKAMFDERFRRLSPDMSPGERRAAMADIEAARKDREATIRLAATRYGGADATATTEVMRESLVSQLSSRMEDAHGGRQLVAGLIRDERPSSATVAAAMRYGMYASTGTDEDLLFHFTERMDRDEIAQMREQFRLQTIDSDHPNGRSLEAELGIYDEGGTFTELSGDDRLRMERAFMGQPRNDKERFEVSMFALQQQRRETGGFGGWLAKGSLAEQQLNATETRLQASVGGNAQFNRRGELIGGANVFDAQGRYVGNRREDFLTMVGVSQQVAQNYSARIDAFANAITMGIAVLGAIAAAVATVATGGAASPLLLAAIAGISGLAAIGANYAIKGGRYGWEQALTDLGMTAVQALTAGIGASLGAGAQAAQKAAAAGAAARASLTGVSKMFTSNAIVNQIIIGSITGAVSGLGSTALNEQTWRGGFDDVLGNLVGGTLRGSLGGAATAAVTSSIDNLSVRGATIGDRMQALSAQGGLLRGGLNVAGRGLARGTIASLGGMAGRATEIGFDAATGRFRGDAGDAVMQIGEAGAHAFVQGVGEGAGEAFGQRWHNIREARRAGVAMEEASQRPMSQSEEQALARARLGEPVEPAVKPLLAAEAVGLPAAAGRALATPEGAPSGAAARPAASVEGEAADLPAQRRGAPHAEGVEEARPGARAFGEGTAAAVEDSDFHGAAARPGSDEAVQRRTVKGAVRRLLGIVDSEFSGGARLPNPRDATRIALTTRSGEEVTVRVRVSKGTLSPDANGDVPVARFRRDEATGHYIVEVSAGASARHVERALAHELAEIRAGHGGTAGDDVLRPRGPAPDRDAQGRPRLSPHDEGRLAELRVLGRQLRTARSEAERTQLRSDVQKLVEHLGLGAATGHADARRAAAFDMLEGHPAAQAALAHAVLAVSPDATRAQVVAERERIGGRVDREMERLPGEPPRALERRAGESAAVGDRSRVDPRVLNQLRAQARRAFGQELQAALLGEIPHNARTMTTLEHITADQVQHVMDTGRLPREFHFHHLMALADFPEFGHRADVGVAVPHDVHMGWGHGDQPRRPVEAAAPVGEEGRPGFHETREAQPRARARHSEIAEGARSTGDVDRDIAIEQRALLRRMEAGARELEGRAGSVQTALDEARAEGATATVDRLERRLAGLNGDIARTRAQIGQIEAVLPQLEQAAALPSGTAAAVRGSRFRGDAEPAPRPHPQVMAEAEAAVTKLTAAGGLVSDAQAARQPDGSIVVTMRSPDGGPDIRVRIIAADVLEPVNGEVPVARYDGDTSGAADYVVRMSARAQPGTGRRALAHELTEIRFAHTERQNAATSDALRPGGFGSEKTGARRPRLSPHDRGRLAEVEVLSHELETARLAGNEPEAARIRDEAQRLLAHLGMIDESRGAQARLAVAERALSDRPESVRRFFAEQAEAAREHPFLRLMPPDKLGRMDLLIDRLAHARQMGDAALEASVFRQAQGLIRFTRDSGNVDFAGEGKFLPRSVRWLQQRAQAEDHPRSAMLYELVKFVQSRQMDYRNTNFGRPPPDPAHADPELVAATERRFGDYRGAQTWEQFRQARFPRGAAATVDELNAAFYEWASGRIVAGSGRLASLVSGSRVPDVTADPGDPQTVAAARPPMSSEVTPGPDGVRRTAQDALEQRRLAMAEAQALRERRPQVADPDELRSIDTRLKELVPLINNPSEALGEAAAVRVARERFNAADDAIHVGRGRDRADAIVDATDPQRIVVIEAKGGNAPLGSRLSRDGTRLVQQGTYEYLDSLAAAMQRPGNPPEVIARGRQLETALRTGVPPIEYYVVRQPVSDDNTQLLDPTISQFPIAKP